MKIIEEYINGLKKAYFNNNAKEIWENFESVIHGASKEDISKLKEVYSNIPDTLVQLLQFVDGTYWREYEGKKLTFYFFGSDIEGYPYYLLSANQIIKNKYHAFRIHADCINRKFDDFVKVDEKIIDNANEMKWLHFSDCMDNGSSQLFIDFSPSKKGVIGQIVRFVHDPDEFQVIANSFDEYLQILIDSEYDFINEDTVG